MADIIQQIRDSYTAFPNAKKTVASFFLNHFEQLQFLTVTELAEKIGVSDTTIINFCKDLGYDGYAEVKRIVRETVQRPTGQQSEAMQSGSEYLSTTLNAMERNLRETFCDVQNIQSIDRAVALMEQARCIHAVGFWRSGNIARDLCLELRRQRRQAQAIVPDLGDYIDKILLIEPCDVALIYDFNLYLAALTEVCVLLKKKGVPIILITDMGPCPRTGYADVILRCRNLNNGMMIPAALNQILLEPLKLPGEEDYDAIREGVFSRFNDYGVLEPRPGRNEHI